MKRYRGCFGQSQVFLELQQHLVHGDTTRNRRMRELAERCDVGTVATNEPWYHRSERSRLHDALTAVRLNASLSEARERLKVNGQYRLKSAAAMTQLFRSHPDALRSAVAIAEHCSDFSLPDYLAGRYRFSDVPTPPGYDAQSWLRRLCEESANRRYGSINRKVRERLDEEFDLIGKHGLAGFFLVYHRIVELARECMLELGHGHLETPLEWLPPGRGRGSSVSMLVGYLIGLSHVDPLEYGLTLDRFLSSETAAPPDIDLDFPRDIRERLILRVIEEWGWDHAALAGMIPTYKARGIVRALGKALGLPVDEVGALARSLETNSVSDLCNAPALLARADRPGWRDLLTLSEQLAGFPKGLAQHPGGMLVSSTPLTDLMPVQPSAIAGRYVAHWDKDSVDDAGVLKIDLLALGALSQMQRAVRLVRQRTGKEPDLSRIDYRDPGVFDDLGRGDTVGVFQVESAAQMQTIVRTRPRDIYELALEVAAVRPGVGANDGVAEFLRRREGMPWDYDHPLERHALERSLGVIMFQDQVVQLGMDVGGLHRRRGRPDAPRFRSSQWRASGGVLSPEVSGRRRSARRTRTRRRGRLRQVQPPLYVSRRPRPGLRLHRLPDGLAAPVPPIGVLRRPVQRAAHGLLGFGHPQTGCPPLGAARRPPRRQPLGTALRRRGRRHPAPGADLRETRRWYDPVGKDARLGETLLRARRPARSPIWQTSWLAPVCHGRRWRTWFGPELWTGWATVPTAAPHCGRWALVTYPARVGDSWRCPWRCPMLPAGLREADRAERMLDEYAVLGLCPDGHVMELARPSLGQDVLTSDGLMGAADGDVVRVAGRVVRRQRPLAAAVFLTLEDEFGLIPLAVWPAQWERLKGALRRSLVVVEGTVSRRDDTLNVAVRQAWPLAADLDDRHGRRDWR